MRTRFASQIRKTGWRWRQPCHVLTFSFILLLTLLPSSLFAAAQLPAHVLTSVTPAGGQRGSTVDVTLKVGEPDSVTELRFSHPGITATQKAGATYSVTIKPDVPIGLYELYAVGRFGISNARLFDVDTLPEIKEGGSNTLGQVINGTVDAAKAERFSFAAKKGQTLIADCLAMRLQSRLDGSLTLADANGKRLASASNDRGIDPILRAAIPADGVYTLSLRDSTLRGGSDYGYRLKVHVGPFVEYSVPAAIQPGKTTRVKLIGHNLPGSQRDVEISAPAEAERTGFIQAHSDLPSFLWRLDNNSRPVRIGLTPHTPAATSATLQVGSEITDVFSDRPQTFRFTVKEAKPLCIEVMSHRLGHAADPLFLLQKINTNDKGEESFADLAAVDDIGAPFPDHKPVVYKHRDPIHTFTPETNRSYRILLKNHFSKAGTPFRLAVYHPQPSFDVRAKFDPPFTDVKKPVTRAPQLLENDADLITINIKREHGHKHPIQIKAEGLPPGLRIDAPVVAPNAKSANIILRSQGDKPSSGTFRLIADDGHGLRRNITLPSLPYNVGNVAEEFHHPHLSAAVPVGVVSKVKPPLKVTLKEKKTWDVCIGSKVSIPVLLGDSAPRKGDVSVVPIAVPGYNKPPTLKIKDKDSEGNLSLNFANANNNKFAPGSYKMILRADGTQKGFALDADVLKAEQEKQKQAEAAQKSAEEALKRAEKERDDHRKNKEANEASIKAAEEKVKQAKTTAEQAKKAKSAADNRAKKAGERAKPRDLKFRLYSEPITINIAETPLKWNVADASGLKAGTNINHTVRITRHFGFDGEVNVKVVDIPGDLKGTKFSGLKFAKDKTEAALNISCNTETKPGTFAAKLQFNFKFNDQNFEHKHPFKITIQ